MNLYIITGTSRGLGNSVAKKLVNENNILYCISRNNDDELVNLASKRNCRLDFINFDLSKVSEVQSFVDTLTTSFDLENVDRITLINNAAVLSPVKTIENCSDIEIINNINVNLVAPMILTSSFIKKLGHFKGDKRIINISSGAARKPYHGWSNYSASKAGLDLFTQSVAKEQEKEDNPVKVVSLAPFIMDTDMQEEIRNTNKRDFEQVERFKKFKDNDILLTPDFVAERVIKLLNNDFINGSFIDVRDIKY